MTKKYVQNVTQSIVRRTVRFVANRDTNVGGVEQHLELKNGIL